MSEERWTLPRTGDTNGWRKLARELAGFVIAVAAGRCIGEQNDEPCIACKARAISLSLANECKKLGIAQTATMKRTRREARCLSSERE